MKINNLILLLLVFSGYLNAENYVTEFPIYVYGDTAPLASIFNSLAMIATSNLYDMMLWIGILWAVLHAGSIATFAGDYLNAAKGVVVVSGALTVLLVPVTVHIVDKRIEKGVVYYDTAAVGNTYDAVENVPWITAISASIATTLSSDMIEMIDDAFGGNVANWTPSSLGDGSVDVSNVGYSSTGFNGTIGYMQKLAKSVSFRMIDQNSTNTFPTDLSNYLENCVLEASDIKPGNTDKFIAPRNDFFASISPTNLGFAGIDAYTLKDTVGTEHKCYDFYDSHIVAKANDVGDQMLDVVQNLLKAHPGALNDSLARVGLADMTGSIFNGSTAELKLITMNLAAVPLTKAAIDNYFRGTEVSGIDLANQMTAASSNAKIMGEGAGQFKWLADILPYAMHFLFGVIVAASIFTIIMAVAQGAGAGVGLVKNYMMGFIQFEGIRVSMALVSNLVLYYSSLNAVDKMREFNMNPISLASMPEYLEYLAMMSGIAGILGVSAIFLIPAIALRGDVSAAASSLQGLAGKYKGNDLDTAMDAATKSGSRERSVAAAKRDDQLMAKLRAMGINDIGSSTPTEYWDKITSELGQTSKEIASLAQKDGLQDYSKGVTTQARQQLAGTAAYGANVNSGAAVKVSIQDGEVEAKTVNETAKSRSMMGDDYNTDDLAKGRALQGMVKDMNSMGAANANLTKEDLKNMKNTGTASMHSEAGRAEAQSDVMKDDPDFYKKSSEYGERSQVSNIKGSMKAYGNDVDAMAKVVEDDSRIKATQQRESVPATLKATGKTGDAAFEKLGEIAEAMSAAKVVSDINTIKGAGGSKSFITASGDVATEKGGMLKAQSEALRGSTGDEGSVIDSKGDLTEDGQKMLNRSASSKVAETLRRSKITDDKKHMASTIADIANSGTSKEDTESIRNQLLKDGIVKSLKIGSDGKVSATGVEMGDFEAVSRALGAAEGNRLTDKMGGLVFGGREFAVKGDSVSSSKNTVNKTEAGYSNNQNTGAPTSDAGAISKEAAEIAQNPTKWLPTLAGKSTDFISNQLQTKFKMDKETADDAAVGISTALAVAGTGAVLEAGQRLKNAVQGNYVVNESFSYDTGKVDKDGKSIMKTINAGEHISTKGMSPELAEAFQENRNKFEVEKGTLGKGFKKINNSAVDLRNSFTGDQPSEESTTKQNNQKDSNAKTNVSKKFHNDSFKNSDTDIISENESDTKKNGSISEQIEKQTKFDRRSGALKNAQTARDNLLSVTSDPDKIAKINADYDLAEKSINEKYGSYGTNQPTVLDADTPKKGFFGRAAETISKVPFVGKAAAGLMLMASAAEANNQFQNGDTSGAVATMLDIADPSSMGVATQFNNSAKILEGRGFGTGATNQTVFDGFMGGVNRTLDAIGLGSPQQQAVMQAQAAGAPAPGWLTASPTANTQAAVMADKDQPTVNTQVANAQPTNAYPNKEQPATSTQSNNVQPEANTQPMANTQAAVMANNTNQPVANTQSMTNTQVAAIQAQIASPQQQATGAPAPGWLTASPMANTQAAVMADNMHSLVGAAQSQKDMAMHQFTSNAVATTQSMAGNDEIGQMKTNLRDNAEATANTLADHLEQLMENQAVKNDQRSKRLDKED